MVDNEATAKSGGTHTGGGGAYVSGNVATGGGMFVGRDNILNVSLHVSGAKLQEITDTLFGLLAAPRVQIRANQVTVGEQSVAVPDLDPALYDAVRLVNPALAARCLLESGAESQAARTAQSQTDLLARLGNAYSHVRSRIEAGLLLAAFRRPALPSGDRRWCQGDYPPAGGD